MHVHQEKLVSPPILALSYDGGPYNLIAWYLQVEVG